MSSKSVKSKLTLVLPTEQNHDTEITVGASCVTISRTQKQVAILYDIVTQFAPPPFHAPLTWIYLCRINALFANRQ
jgi:hypothetical protein